MTLLQINTDNTWLWIILVSSTIALIGFLTRSWFLKIIDQMEKTNNILTEIKILLRATELDIEYLKKENIEIFKVIEKHADRLIKAEQDIQYLKFDKE